MSIGVSGHDADAVVQFAAAIDGAIRTPSTPHYHRSVERAGAGEERDGVPLTNPISRCSTGLARPARPVDYLDAVSDRILPELREGGRCR
jgi:hypothetical protein